MRKGILTLALIAGFCAVGLMNDSAQARPAYLKVFGKTYPNLAEPLKTSKCMVCHPEKKKAVKNDYGKAVGEGLTQKNEKAEDAIGKAIKGAEDKKNADGKTYGEIIEGGNLPN